MLKNFTQLLTEFHSIFKKYHTQVEQLVIYTDEFVAANKSDGKQLAITH